jgi:methionyl-tRNA formyltransferase
MGVEAILESVSLIKEGRAPKIPQDESRATYEPPCDDRVAAIDWHKPAQKIYDLVRGCDPRPGAYADWMGEKIRFYGASLLAEPTEEAPGTIVQLDAQGIQVAVPGGKLVIGKVRPATAGKVGAADFAAEKGLQVGDQFGGKS